MLAALVLVTSVPTLLESPPLPVVGHAVVIFVVVVLVIVTVMVVTSSEFFGRISETLLVPLLALPPGYPGQVAGVHDAIGQTNSEFNVGTADMRVREMVRVLVSVVVEVRVGVGLGAGSSFNDMVENDCGVWISNGKYECFDLE